MRKSTYILTTPPTIITPVHSNYIHPPPDNHTHRFHPLTTSASC